MTDDSASQPEHAQSLSLQLFDDFVDYVPRIDNKPADDVFGEIELRIAYVLTAAQSRRERQGTGDGGRLHITGLRFLAEFNLQESDTEAA